MIRYLSCFILFITLLNLILTNENIMCKQLKGMNECNQISNAKNIIRKRNYSQCLKFYSRRICRLALLFLYDQVQVDIDSSIGVHIIQNEKTSSFLSLSPFGLTMSREFNANGIDNQSKWDLEKDLEKKEGNMFKIKNVEGNLYLGINSKYEIIALEDDKSINQIWRFTVLNKDKYRICRYEDNNLCLAVRVYSDNSEEIVLTEFKRRNDIAIKQKTWFLKKLGRVSIIDETTLETTTRQPIPWNTNSDGSWSMGCKFDGNDLTSVSSKGEDCSTICRRTDGCTHYTWTRGSCLMKKGTISQSDAIKESDAFVCGIVVKFPIESEISWNDASDGTWALGCDFFGNDLSNVNSKGKDCFNRCQKTFKCTHYTWTDYNGGTCWMKTGSIDKTNAIKKSMNGFVCGILI